MYREEQGWPDIWRREDSKQTTTFQLISKQLKVAMISIHFSQSKHLRQSIKYSNTRIIPKTMSLICRTYFHNIFEINSVNKLKNETD